MRFVARAIERASEVLPTPGGPTKHRIGPFGLLTSCRTARNSTIRSLTFSSPKWSSFRIFSAADRSLRSRVFLVQGTAISQSR